MMKGHVKIELFDHKTGKLKKIERENMLTNALAYRAGIDSNDTLGLYSSEYSIMPLGTKGLGGLYLFDGPLTEDADNVHFPMDVHLTGCRTWHRQSGQQPSGDNRQHSIGIFQRDIHHGVELSAEPGQWCDCCSCPDACEGG